MKHIELIEKKLVIIFCKKPLNTLNNEIINFLKSFIYKNIEGVNYLNLKISFTKTIKVLLKMQVKTL